MELAEPSTFGVLYVSEKKKNLSFSMFFMQVIRYCTVQFWTRLSMLYTTIRTADRTALYSSEQDLHSITQLYIYLIWLFLWTLIRSTSTKKKNLIGRK